MAKCDPHVPVAKAARWLAIGFLMVLASCAKVADSPPAASNTTQPAPATTDQTTAPAEKPSDTTDSQAADTPTAEVASANTTDQPPAATGSVVRGTVKLDGPPPARLEIDMTRVPECVKIHGKDKILNEDVIVGPAGEVKNAFVYVKRAPKQADVAPPSEPAVLDQMKCMYRPRVQGIRVGQTLQIRNSDDFAHNIRGYPQLNPIFNIGQPGKNNVREKVFDLVEVPPIKFKCDIHPWMTAYVFVMDHPYFAVSGEDGTYEIAGLPPGDYTLAVWHEAFGKDQQPVSVGDNDVSGADFTLKSKK